MDETQVYDLAERYLSKELSAQEREQVDERLKSDQSFGKTFAKYLVAKQVLKEKAEAEWRKELLANYVEKETPSAKKTGKRRSLRWIAVAAAAVLLLGIIAYLFTPPSSQSPYAEEINLVYQEKIFEATDRSNTQFTVFFNNKQYTEALTEAQQQYNQANPLSQLKWLERQGFCYLAQSEWDKALAIFEDLETNSVYQPASNPALWYKALTYLGSGDDEKCKQLLGDLVAMPQHDDREKARRLLQRL